MKTVPLHGKKAAGRVALVDDEDYDLVMQHRWTVLMAADKRVTYAQANVKRADGTPTTIKMHKLITGWPQTDHSNGDGLDNQRSNLRPATSAQNTYNRRPWAKGRSQYKGVSWASSRRRWLAQIQVNRKSKALGWYVNEIDAALAYDHAARHYFGEYAWLNFPDAADAEDLKARTAPAAPPTL